MKTIKIILTVALNTLLLFSCKKEADSTYSRSVANNNTVGIRWSDLPAEYKNAVVVTDNDQTFSVQRSANTIVHSFGPYGMLNVTNPKFSLFPPVSGSVISAIGLSEHPTAHYLNNITIWFKQPDGVVVMKQAGVQLSQNDLLTFRQLTTNEYLNRFSLTSDVGGVTHLSLITNKATIGAGVESGIPYAGATSAGTWILSMKGYAFNSIQQITLNTYCKPWQKITGSDGQDIAVAADGTAYLVNSAGNIYERTGDSWRQMQGSDGERIAANGGEVCMVNSAGNIYVLIGIAWSQLAGSDALDIAIDSDGTRWMVNTAGKIYRYNLNVIDHWQQMPGSDARRIAAGAGQVWMINSVGNIYKWNSGSWTKTNGSDAKDIAVSKDGNVWMTNTAGLIYKAENGGNLWFELAGSDGSSIAANNNKVMMTNTVGNIYKLTY